MNMFVCVLLYENRMEDELVCSTLHLSELLSITPSMFCVFRTHLKNRTGIVQTLTRKTAETYINIK